MRRYGLTLQDVRALTDRTVCDACGEKFDPRVGSQKSKHIDHDHATGSVRGVLCQQCNLALGYLEDSLARIAALGEYIRSQSAAKAA